MPAPTKLQIEVLRKAKLKALSVQVSTSTRTALLCASSRGTTPHAIAILEGDRVVKIAPEKPKGELRVAEPDRLLDGQLLCWVRPSGRAGKIDAVNLNSLEVREGVLKVWGSIDSFAIDPTGRYLAVLATEEDPDFPDIVIYDNTLDKLHEPKCDALIDARITGLRWPNKQFELECTNLLTDGGEKLSWNAEQNTIEWMTSEVQADLSEELRQSLKYAIECGPFERFKPVWDQAESALSPEQKSRMLEFDVMLCREDRLKKAQFFIQQGVKPSPAAFSIAVRSQELSLIEEILKTGADAGGSDPSGTPYLFNGETVETLKLLLDRGACVDATDGKGQTILHQYLLPPDGAEFLIQAGADPNARDRNGQTPLHCTNPDTAKVLLAHGADVKATDKNGDTVLHVPRAMVDLMVQHGAVVNATNNKGETPLLVHLKTMNNYALDRNYTRVKRLLEAGADPTLADKRSVTPWKLIDKPKPAWLKEFRDLFEPFLAKWKGP